MATEQLARVSLGPRDRLLDIGCGNGKITAAIADRIPEGSVLGVDPSQNMIDFARANYGTEAHPNLHFDLGDARSLPYRHEFDQIVSQYRALPGPNWSSQHGFDARIVALH
jgi:ubiquinone/menaquinone biosynthesis C-methylase UbiE